MNKLNDFGRKRTDFKNTLYKSEIHVDKFNNEMKHQISNKNSSHNKTSRDNEKQSKLISSKLSLKDKCNNCNSNLRKFSINKSSEDNHNYNYNSQNNQEKDKEKDKNYVNSTKKIILAKQKTFLNNNTHNTNANTNNDLERNALTNIKNKKRRELRLTNVDCVQLANVNMSNTFSNNPILRLSENTIMRVDKVSETDIFDKLKSFQNKKPKPKLNSKANANEKQQEYERVVSFSNFQPLNQEKIGNMEKAKKIMYENKMGKLIDYFRQGGI